MKLARSIVNRLAPISASGLLALSCASRPDHLATSAPGSSVARSDTAPTMMRPDGQAPAPRVLTEPVRVIELPGPGIAVRGTAPAQRIDTRDFVPQIQNLEVDPALHQRVRNYLPEHDAVPAIPLGAPNDLSAGGTLANPRAIPGPQWPALTNTGWVPPDPTLAVGPNHVVVTVNQSIAFYTKAGVQQLAVQLNNTGTPGFFEPIGAGNFTFDPKVFYDHYSQRFVVMAPEYYQATLEAYITIAVSDDSDPNGVWHKYRTDAVISDGTRTYWWDYPGFGYDQNGYYVTCNLFGLSSSGFGGTGFRIFDKAPMLTGAPAVYSTIQIGGISTVQGAQHFGTPQAAFLASTSGTSSIRIQAIRDALTTPTIATTTVTVPLFTNPISPFAPDGTTITHGGSSTLQACWRDGKLYSCHNVSIGGRNQVRWYIFNTGNWPTSGSVTLLQSGTCDPGGDKSSLFPAAFANARGDVGLVFGVSSVTQNPGVMIAGRKSSDPPGTIGAPTLVKNGEATAGGRWGDYFALALDPADSHTLWYVGEYRRTSGWGTWVGSFTISCRSDIDNGSGTGTPDGGVDISDLLYFLFLFDAGNLGADLDNGTGTGTPDGGVDISDLLYYLSLFDAGC